MVSIKIVQEGEERVRGLASVRQPVEEGAIDRCAIPLPKADEIGGEPGGVEEMGGADAKSIPHDDHQIGNQPREMVNQPRRPEGHEVFEDIILVMA